MEKYWYKKWWVVALFVFLGIILLSGGRDDSKNSKITPSQETSPVQQEETVTVFDVESLYGKNIDEIRTILGEPIDGEWAEPTESQLAGGTKEWDNTFKRDEYELLVTYDVASRKIIDFFIGTDDPSGGTKDTKKLERILNVENSANFTIKPVKAIKDPSVYTGIIVMPR